MASAEQSWPKRPDTYSEEEENGQVCSSRESWSGVLLTPVSPSQSKLYIYIFFKLQFQERKLPVYSVVLGYFSSDSSSVQFTPAPQSIFSHCLSCTQHSRGPGDFPNYFEGEGGVIPLTNHQLIAGPTQIDKQLSTLVHNRQFRVANSLSLHAFGQ